MALENHASERVLDRQRRRGKQIRKSSMSIKVREEGGEEVLQVLEPLQPMERTMK